MLNNATLLDVGGNSFARKRLHYLKQNWTTLQTANKKKANCNKAKKKLPILRRISISIHCTQTLGQSHLVGCFAGSQLNELAHVTDIGTRAVLPPFSLTKSAQTSTRSGVI